MWELVRRLPEPVAFGIGDVAGRVAHSRARALRQRVRANLARVVDSGHLDGAVADAFRSYARYWVEAFRAADIADDATHVRTCTSGFHHLDGVLDEGRGAIVLLAHHGSWDMAARWAESHGYHLAVVAEVLRPRQVFERFVRLREAIGLEVVPLPPRSRLSRLSRHRAPGRSDEERAGSDGGADWGTGSDSAMGPGQASLAGRLGAVLEANHLVGLLTDRDLSGRAPEVELFGERTRIPLGAAVLACRSGTPIVPITMLQRAGRRWHLQVQAPIRAQGRSVRDVHADVVAALEELICLDPAQWHAFQPVWRSADADSGGPRGERAPAEGPPRQATAEGPGQ
jgi:KDO2-lipid IV(A) lauroyltransferase